MFPDVQKIFKTYNNFSKNTVVFQNIHFLIQNYLNSSENLLQIYLNLPKSALEIYLKFLTSNYQGCCTPPPPPVSFKQTLSDLLFMYFTSQNIVHHTQSRAICCCHALAWFKFMNFYYIKNSVL